MIDIYIGETVEPFQQSEEKEGKNERIVVDKKFMYRYQSTITKDGRVLCKFIEDEKGKYEYNGMKYRLLTSKYPLNLPHALKIFLRMAQDADGSVLSSQADFVSFNKSKLEEFNRRIEGDCEIQKIVKAESIPR